MQTIAGCCMSLSFTVSSFNYLHCGYCACKLTLQKIKYFWVGFGKFHQASWGTNCHCLGAFVGEHVEFVSALALHEDNCIKQQMKCSSFPTKFSYKRFSNSPLLRSPRKTHDNSSLIIWELPLSHSNTVSKSNQLFLQVRRIALIAVAPYRERVLRRFTRKVENIFSWFFAYSFDAIFIPAQVAPFLFKWLRTCAETFHRRWPLPRETQTIRKVWTCQEILTRKFLCSLPKRTDMIQKRKH